MDIAMEKSLPRPTIQAASRPRARRVRLRVLLPFLAALVCFLVLVYGFAFGQGIAFWEAYLSTPSSAHHRLPPPCRALHAAAGPPRDFAKRTQSDRWVPGTRPVLVKNAKIWTGGKNGTEVVDADVLLDKGVIKGVGRTAVSGAARYKREELLVVDARGAWVTPGYVFLYALVALGSDRRCFYRIVDLHSHLGDAPSPALDGAEDDNSLHGTINPWLRALDGLNTHDDSYTLSVAGGVTTALVLPGSADAIGKSNVIRLQSIC